MQARRYLFARFGSNWLAINMWHRSLLDQTKALGRIPFHRSLIVTALAERHA